MVLCYEHFITYHFIEYFIRTHIFFMTAVWLFIIIEIIMITADRILKWHDIKQHFDCNM